VSTALVLATCTLLGSTASAADPLDSLALVYDDGMGGTLPYRLFLPPGYDEPGAEFPLVLFLHGAGERGDDNLAQVTSHINGLIDATQSERFASFLLAPQVPSGQSWTGGGNLLAPAMQLTTEIIAQLETQYQVDPSRRYVTGLSMGGFGTFDVIAKRPDMFAAAAPMSGGGSTSRAADMADVPLWAFHGDRDTTVPVSATRNMIQALVDVGSDPIYLESDGGHNIWGPIYQDPHDELYAWMFEGVAPPLATLLYNATTGNLKIDATSAPGGNIWKFSLRANIFTAPDIDEINGGQVLINDQKTAMIYRGSLDGGFGGVLDLGTALPAGLNLADLNREFTTIRYGSRPTGSDDRTFRFQVVVPEPATIGLLASIGLFVLPSRRRRNTPAGGPSQFFCSGESAEWVGKKACEPGAAASYYRAVIGRMRAITLKRTS
jgi:predicted esterase